MEPEATGFSLCGIAELPTLPSDELGHLVDVGLLQVVDVLRDLAERSPTASQQQEELGEAVAGGLGRHPRHAEAKLASSARPARAGPTRPSAASVPTAPPSSPTSTRGRDASQALALAQQLVEPDRRLVAEGDRQRVLAVGAPRHHRAAVPARQPRQDVRHRVELGEHHRVAVALICSAVPRVDDVLAGGAPVDVAAPTRR